MSNGRNWSSQKGSGNTWNPTKDAEGVSKEEALESDYLDGFYVDRKDGVGQYGATVIVIETEEGVKNDVWCGTVLKDLINGVRLGSFVRLQWLGPALKKAAQSKKPAAIKDTDYFQNWDVMVDKDTPPMEVAGSAPATPASTNKATATNKVPEGKSPSKAEIDDLPF